MTPTDAVPPEMPRAVEQQPDVVPTEMPTRGPNLDWLPEAGEAAGVTGSRTREGDQRLPSALLPQYDDQELLIEDIRARRELGVARYGQAHQPWNGRDTLRDMYEEQLDFLVYLRSVVRMTVTSREELFEVVKAILTDPEVRAKARDEVTEDFTEVDFFSNEITDRLMGFVAGNALRITQDPGNMPRRRR